MAAELFFEGGEVDLLGVGGVGAELARGGCWEVFSHGVLG